MARNEADLSGVVVVEVTEAEGEGLNNPWYLFS